MHWNENYDFVNNFKYMEILYMLGLLVSNFFVFTFCLIIDKNNSPCHIFIMFIFGQIAYFTNQKNVSLVSVIIAPVIILFFSLVFNEIIELNFCGLSRNTKRNMASRAKDEIIESNLLKKQEFEGDDEIKVLEDNAKELNPILN